MRAGCREKSERRFAADTGSAEVCGSPMDEAALQGLLSERTFPRFAEEVAREVRDSGAVEVLYGLITERAEALPRAVRHRYCFAGPMCWSESFSKRQSSSNPASIGFAAGTFRPAAMRA